MFYLYTSNRLEVLARHLALLLRQANDSPLTSATILIQSRGMERWLSMKIAEYNGICANIRFMFPNSLIFELFKLVLPDISEDGFLDVEFMKWKLAKIIPSFKDLPFLKELPQEKKDLRLFQLCSLIADTFDQYIIFRPDMIFRWERGYEDHWQARLFRILISETNGIHRAKLAKFFLEKIPEKKSLLPSQIYIFGISSLPRFHLDIIYAISNIVDVYMFLMNPCQQYWGDIISEKEFLKEKPSLRKEFHLEIGNPLLSSLGKLGRDLFDIINEYNFISHEEFYEPDENSLLSYIQSDILNLRNPFNMEKREIKADDLSIQIHSCHSPLREVEVLFNNILKMLEKDPSLKPKDILVMTPNIDKYAPFIQAVFGSPDTEVNLPFSIADRSPKLERKLIRAFFKVLELRNTRIEASKVLDVLECEPISKRFGIRSEDIDVIRRWVREAGIRWGIDKENRSKWTNFLNDTGTWKSGIESLLLGYALLDEREGVFQDIFPYDRSEGNVELLGRFVDFLNKLFKFLKEFSKKKTIKQWQELFFSIIDELLFLDEQSYHDAQLLRNTISDMSQSAEKAGFYEKVDVDIPVWNIERLLSRKGYGSRFLTGGITFCAMLPMRSIPFKVICLIGMNYEEFPRHTRSWEFDLIQRYPRKGDRSKRDDDRYLFLESILSARKILYISYVGRSIKDNSSIPPSVVVSELIDYIEQGFYVKDKDIIRCILFEHPMHPFSPLYFRGERLVSYSKDNLDTAKAMMEDRVAIRPFLKELPETKSEDEIKLEDLFSFFSHPIKFLLKNKLNILLESDQTLIEDSEPLRFKGLDRYKFEQLLLEDSIKRKRAKFKQLMQKRGLLPLGGLGEYEFSKSRYKLDLFLKEIIPHLQRQKREIEVESSINGLLIKGKIKDIYEDELLLYRFARIKASDRIRFWICYLMCILNEIPISGAAFVGLNEKERPSILRCLHIEKEQAYSYISDLIAIYKDGMKRAIHFFPESGWKYIESLYIKKEEKEKAIQKARLMWQGNNYVNGEGSNQYYEYCFRGSDPLDEEFFELSKKVFFPMILNTTKEEL